MPLEYDIKEHAPMYPIPVILFSFRRQVQPENERDMR